MFSYQFESALKEEIEKLQVAEMDSAQVILQEGAYIKEVPILLSGSIRLRRMDESGKEITLYRIAPGESCILSITSCINEKPSKAEAIVEEKSEFILVPSEKVKEWNGKYPEWRKFIMQLYYDRLDQVLNLVDAIAFQQVDTRLENKLLQLRSKFGDTIPVTHQDLANDIGTAREVVSRLLKNLEVKNKIRLERGVIKIIDLV